MKAKVIKRFSEGRRKFDVGDTLDVKEEAVYHNNNWICDIPSQFFGEHFKIVEEES